jgi:hypothetical protein
MKMVGYLIMQQPKGNPQEQKNQRKGRHRSCVCPQQPVTKNEQLTVHGGVTPVHTSANGQDVLQEVSDQVNDQYGVRWTSSLAEGT